MASPKLTTLEIAVSAYAGLTLRAARSWIRAGKLPASRVGKHYFVDPDDLARLLAPKVRSPVNADDRKSPGARAEAQFARAGLR